MTWSADFPADDWLHISDNEIAARALQRIEARGRGMLLLHDIKPATVTGPYNDLGQEPHSLQEVEKRRSLCRTDDPTIRIRRDRLDGPNLDMRRCDAAKLPLRGSQCPAHPRSKVVGA
jgi:hypothetical protein